MPNAHATLVSRKRREYASHLVTFCCDIKKCIKRGCCHAKNWQSLKVIFLHYIAYKH